MNSFASVTRSVLVRFAALLSIASVVPAQVATAVLREGDAPVGAGFGATVLSVGGAAVNDVGGYAALIYLTSNTSAVWGNASGGAGALLRESQLGIAGYNQLTFDSFFGIDDLAHIAYGAADSLSGTILGPFGSTWLDSAPLAIPDQLIPTLPGKKWRSAERAGITANGIPYWVSGINDVATNANEGNGIFYGSGASVLLKTGDASPAPLTSTLGANAGDLDVRFSSGGTHHISVITTTDPVSSDTHLVIDGAIALDAGGARVSEGGPISAAAGGVPGEKWSSFGSLGIDDAGNWLFAGMTSGSAPTNAVLCRNGAIVHREGDTLDGLTLTSGVGVAGACMNAAGDVAFVWPTLESGLAVYINGELMLKRGDPVDFDGDGIVEPTSTFKDAPSTASLAMSRDALYFPALVTSGGVDRTCLLRIRFSVTHAFCAGDGTATACPCGNFGDTNRGCGNSVVPAGAQLMSMGLAAIGSDSLVLHGDGMPDGPALYMQGTSQQAGGAGVPFGDGLRCLGGGVIRLGIAANVNGLSHYPQPGDPPISIRGLVVAPGTRFYQVWYRNSAAFCTAGTFNLSNGLRVEWLN